MGTASSSLNELSNVKSEVNEINELSPNDKLTLATGCACSKRTHLGDAVDTVPDSSSCFRFSAVVDWVRLAAPLLSFLVAFIVPTYDWP